ncbi:MAG: putative kinase, aminoglycoside phosphotransferase family [Actinomycetia bacterium]|nr:putative kinase, aminoglycoside phosphotransferase family [Actinomycetes bacterium]
MAIPMPTAEVDVTAGLVRELLAAQHPDLARLPVEFLANGWDNANFRLGEQLLARMPRRALGAQIIAHEQRWLPVVAPRLPLPIPCPSRTGVPGPGFPYPWSVVPYLPGVAAAGADGGGVPLDLAAVAAQLGGFLRALHVTAPADAPANPFRGVPLSQRAATFEVNLALLAGSASARSSRTQPPIVDEAAVRHAWAQALAAPAYDGPPLWLHGDLHPANVLVQHGHVSGIIDFGDITAGDPAPDLSVAWMLLPPRWHDAFRVAYGGVGDDLWRRARGWALALGVVFLAHSADNPQIHGIGRRTVAAILEG